MFAEHGKEHGYFVLAVLRDFKANCDKKFHRVPSHRKEHGYFVLAISILKIEDYILNKKQRHI
jgi:hypothetical protein